MHPSGVLHLPTHLPFVPFLPLFLALLTTLTLPPAATAQPAEDGLYAGFETSEGSFWCRLHYERAPRTVANFILLAEGTRDWIDFPPAHVVRRPFYDGLTFHRVITNFMIQGGSPNGLGTDGPGYRFADEFHADLNHSQPGTLSMANSGPDSNGSQFFVTVAPTPWLNGLHSVFGQVVEGLDTVVRISEVPRNASDRPLQPVTLQRVRIVRQGPAALAFDPTTVTPPLPTVGVVPIALTSDANSLNLLLQSRPLHIQHVFFGTNLVTWNVQAFPGAVTNLNASDLRTLPEIFFRVLDGSFEP